MSGMNDGKGLARRRPDAPLPIAQDTERREEWRARERLQYIRQHAPTILAGMVGLGGSTEFKRLRRRAIIEAGLLFDETEGK